MGEIPIRVRSEGGLIFWIFTISSRFYGWTMVLKRNNQDVLDVIIYHEPKHLNMDLKAIFKEKHHEFLTRDEPDENHDSIM